MNILITHSLKISLKNSIQSNNDKNNIILKSALVFPQQSMEIYIQNMIKLKKRKQQIVQTVELLQQLQLQENANSVER